MQTLLKVTETVEVTVTITADEQIAYRNAEIAKLQKKIEAMQTLADDELCSQMASSVKGKLAKKIEKGETLQASYSWAEVKSFKAGKGKSEWVEFLEENGLDKKEQDGLYAAHKIAAEMYTAFSSLLPEDILKQKIGEAKAVATCKSEYKYLVMDFLFAE